MPANELTSRDDRSQNGDLADGSAELPAAGEGVRERLRQFQLTDLRDADGKVKTDPVTGNALINGLNAALIQELLMRAMAGDRYLDVASGEVWKVALGHGLHIGDLKQGQLAGKAYLAIYIDSKKASAIDERWPTEVVDVPIRYEIRGKAT